MAVISLFLLLLISAIASSSNSPFCSPVSQLQSPMAAFSSLGHLQPPNDLFSTSILTRIDSSLSFSEISTLLSPFAVSYSLVDCDSFTLAFFKSEHAIDHLQEALPSLTFTNLLHYFKGSAHILGIHHAQMNVKRDLDITNQFLHQAQLVEFLENVTQTYPTLTSLFKIGKSVQNRDMYVLRITAGGSDHSPIENSPYPPQSKNKPKFKFAANIHGDETTGREMCIRFIDYVCSQYENGNETIVELLNRIDIYIVPTLNPDGFELGRRSNFNGIDLNRNYPDHFVDPQPRLSDRQLETQVIMKWMEYYTFSLSTVFHGGALVANYPWDGRADGKTMSTISASPDNAMFEFVSRTYSNAHTFMHSSTEFPGGITNGAKWYVLYGGSQDWHLVYHNCPEITLEVSDVKWLNPSLLPQYWDANRDAMVRYMSLVLHGVRGHVVDAVTDEGLGGVVLQVRKVGENQTRQHVFSEAETGEFYKVLEEGQFSIELVIPTGYKMSRKSPSNIVNFTIGEEMVDPVLQIPYFDQVFYIVPEGYVEPVQISELEESSWNDSSSSETIPTKKFSFGSLASVALIGGGAIVIALGFFGAAMWTIFGKKKEKKYATMQDEL